MVVISTTLPKTIITRVVDVIEKMTKSNVELVLVIECLQYDEESADDDNDRNKIGCEQFH